MIDVDIKSSVVTNIKKAINSRFCAITNNNGYTDGFKNIIAFSNSEKVEVKSFTDLETLINSQEKTLFGLLSYDIKNEINNLNSNNSDLLHWPNYLFFESEVEIEIIDTIPNIDFSEDLNLHEVPNALISKDAYINTINNIKEMILDGEVYEINYCIPFLLRNVKINPYQLYQRLNRHSSMPFSAFFKHDDKYIISASPERFIQKNGKNLKSQPMKGTIKRSTHQDDDITQIQLLKNSEKERAENLMIVDLVRHDFKKSCKTGSIKVTDLFEVKTYPKIHQMISTINGVIKDDLSISEVIKNTFPMGSMTGAPKLRAMELIEKLEITKRGPFSGAFGYINPKGDLDFNVLIRSIFYDATQNTLTFQAGSAITIDSDPEQEYEECLLKANSIFNSLANQQ